MKTEFRLGLMIIAFILPTLGCAHMSDPCDDKLLNRIRSPDGSLILATYHRECRSKIYTTAALEKPSRFWESSGKVVCYVMSWGDRHPIEATWKANDSISISTSDRLEKLDFEGSKESCAGIQITYNVQFRNERQRTDDPEVVSKIRNVLSQVGPCIDAYYKAGYPTNDPVGYVNELIDRGEHRSAVELILGYTYTASCPISPATYDSLKELSTIFDLKPGYVENVTSLVK